MKTKSIFRKPRVIITALVLAVLVALTAVVVIMAQEKAEFAGVRVTTSGKLNMEFYYNIKDSEAGITKARVEISDGGLDPQEEYVDLVSVDEDTVVATVRLDAAEMGYDVVVTPVTNNGEGEDACAPQEWSMRKYAELVLANEANAEYFAPLKAILNYGSFAKEYFANVQEYPFNPEVEDIKDGIFTRLSNPISAIASKIPAASAYSATSSNEELIPQDSLELTMVLNDTIELRLYYAYNGDSDAHTGAANYDESKGKYFVKVGLIDTEHFTSDYGVKLGVKVNGQTVVSVQNATVLNFIANLAAQEETKDLAGAMYYYYYWTNDESVATIDQATCAHTTHFESTSIDSGVSTVVCSLCAKDFDVEVNDGINYFSAPGQIINNWASSNTEATGGVCSPTNSLFASRAPLTDIVTDEHGTYTRVHMFQGASVFLTNGTVTAAENQEANKNNLLAKGETAGKYAVLKIRTINMDMVKLGVVCDNGAGVSFSSFIRRGTEDVLAGTSENNGEFITYVIDLTSILASDTDASSVCVVLGGQSDGDVVAGARIDVQYFALCDSWEEVAMVAEGDDSIFRTTWLNGKVGDLTYTSSDLKANIDGTCFDECVAGNNHITVEGNTVHYFCNVCGVTEMMTATRPTVGAGVGEINFYSAPGQQWNNWATADYAGATAHGNVSVPSGKVMVENGVMFNRIYLGTSATFKFYGGNSSDVKLGWETPGETVYGGSGRYAVLKVRGTYTNLQFGAYDGKTPLENGGDSVLSTSRVNYSMTSDGWYIQVIDLEKFSKSNGTTKVEYFTVDEALEKVGMALRANTSKNDKSQYIDVQYFALCDTWDEVATVVGADNVVTYTSWSSYGFDAHVLGDGTCTDHRNAKLQSVEGNVYTYKCMAPNCNNYTFTVTVPEKDLTGINFYSAPGQQSQSYNAFVTGTNQAVGVLCEENGVVFNRIHFNVSGAFVFTDATDDGRSGVQNAVDDIQGSGNYVVMKIRMGSALLHQVRLGLYDGGVTKEGGHDAILAGTASNTGRSNLTAMKNGWVVYVIDIASMNPVYYTAGNDELTKASFGFKINNGDGSQAGDYVDIAYFAVCDDWAEIKQVVGTTDSIVYTNWKDAATDVAYSNEHANADDCKVVISSKTTDAAGNVTFTYSCESPLCNKSNATVTVPASVNYYSAAGQQLNHWACVSEAGQGSNLGAISALGNIKIADGEVFHRVYTNQGAQLFFSDGTRTNQDTKTPEEKLNGGTGRYIVIRMRAEKQDFMQFQMNTDDKGDAGWYPARYTEISSEFITYIIDRGSPFSTTAQKIYAGVAFNTGASAQAGAYIDIAYYALVDNWTEINALIGDENAIYVGDWGTTEFDREIDCAKDKHGEVIKITEGNVYKLVCGACGKAFTSVDTTDINMFMAPGKWQSNTAWGSHTDGRILVDNKGVAYTRFYEGGGTVDNYRHNGSICLSSPKNDDYSCDNINGNTANYVAIKVKAHLVDAFKVGIGMNGKGTDCNGTAINMKPYDGEWVVVVIDLAAAKQAGIAYSDQMAVTDVTNISVNLVPSAAYEGHYIDFAYMAVCDDWAELKEVVGSDEFVFTNVANFSSAPTYDLNGNCSTDCAGDYVLTSSENGVNTYTCAGFCYNADTNTLGCTTTKTLEIPTVGAAGVNWYTAPNAEFAYGRKNAFGLGSTKAKAGNVKYDAVNDVLYTHIAVSSNGEFEILNGSAEPAADGSQTQQIYGAARYAVIKMRTSATTGDLRILYINKTTEGNHKIEAGWDMYVGANSRKAFADGWAIYVIDLAMFDACGAVSSYTSTSITKTVFAMRAVSGLTSIDMAYFALCDNWAEIQSVVGDEKVILTSWNYNGGETAENNLEQKTIADQINYWVVPTSKNYGMGMNLWNAGGKGGGATIVGALGTDGDTIYSRVTIQRGGSFELEHRVDQKFAQKTRSTMDANLIGGVGKYMVVRMRIGSTASQIQLMARNDGSDGESYASRSGLKGKAEYQEFRTYVIDVSVFGNMYSNNNNNYKATFAMKGYDHGDGNHNAETDYFDIQYFAICDNWTEVQTVVGTNVDVIHCPTWGNAGNDVPMTAADLQAAVDAEKAN